MAGATVAVAGAALTGRPPVSRAASAPRVTAAEATWRHGGALAQRGVDITSVAGREAEGRFGLMFKKLRGYAPPDEALVDLARAMTEPAQPAAGDPGDNPRVPAGFTFLGQFVDHDMTFDQTPLGTQQLDPHGLTNFDTPRFDLASVYGRGPQASPDLYDATSPGRLRLVQPQGIDDLPRRADGSAYIGDPRNDENLIVCQLHIAFIKFHNRLVDEGHDFADAQRLTQWHFQWLLVHDYLEHVVGKATVERFLDEQQGRIKCRREHYKPKNPHRPMMPIEYSVAAFRFGHSMVRGGYLMNIPASGPPNGGPTFTNPPSDHDLHGSRPIPAHFKIDWQHFFALPGSHRVPANLARRIDTKLSPPLHDLPASVVPPDLQPLINDLAERNLLRGKRVGLPAGQDVARRDGHHPAREPRPRPDRSAVEGQGAAVVLRPGRGRAAPGRPAARPRRRADRRRDDPRNPRQRQGLLLSRARLAADATRRPGLRHRRLPRLRRGPPEAAPPPPSLPPPIAAADRRARDPPRPHRPS